MNLPYANRHPAANGHSFEGHVTESNEFEPIGHSCVRKDLLDERVALNVLARHSGASTVYVRAVFSSE